MSYNGAGTFTLDAAGNPVVTDTDISSTVHNATMDELAAGLSLAICRDGQSTITQAIPFNNKKITGLGGGLLQTDAINIQNLINQTGIYIATVGGTGNAITLTSFGAAAIQAYNAGMVVSFIATATNTNTVTVNVDSLGVKDIQKGGTIALSPSDIVSGQLVTLRYDGTRFQIQNPLYTQGSWTPSVGGTATYTLQTGYWTKVGRLCHVVGHLTINAIGTGSTSVISGLPFNAADDQALTVCDFASLATNVVWIGARVNINAQTITRRNLTAAGASATSSALFGNSAAIKLSGVYITA